MLQVFDNILISVRGVGANAAKKIIVVVLLVETSEKLRSGEQSPRSPEM
jgi:hypothetical protein